MIALAIQFLRPLGLLALPLAVLPVWAAIRHRRRGLHVWRVGVAMQVLAVLLGAMTLAKPEVLTRAGAEAKWLVFVDVSPSVRGQAVPPELDAWPMAKETFRFADQVLGPQEPPAGRQTRLTPVLSLAASRAGSVAGVLLCTDGQFHDDWIAAAQAVRQAGLPLVIVPLESPPRDARVVDLRPQRSAEGKVSIAAIVRATDPQRRTAVLRRQGQATPLLEQSLHLLPWDVADVRAEDSPPAAQAVTYVATLTPADAFPENDSASALLLPLHRPVAVVSADRPMRELREQMETEWIDPCQAPTGVGGWSQFAAVLVIDSTGQLLPEAARAALAGYVRDGGGLVLIGAGPYGRPADRDDPLNQVAPLVANPFERRPMKVVIFLDASGSMGESGEGEDQVRPRFSSAVNAVMAMREHLTAQDSLAVVAFSDEPRVVYDSNAGPPDFALLRQALADVRPAGPTYAGKALLRAAELIVPPRQQGLAILVSDLRTRDFSAEQVARGLREARMDLAVVEIAAPDATDEPPALVRLAELTGATRVRRQTLSGLADVFARFLRSARGSPVRTAPAAVSLADRPFGLPSADWPDADAIVLTAPQGRAEVLGRAGGEPLLARWQAGLGRAVSIALVADDPSANRELRGRLQWPQLLSAAARWARSPADDPRFSGELRHDDPRLRLTVQASDANGPMNLLDLSAQWLDANGQVRSEPMRQAAPGRYLADWIAPGRPGQLVVRDATGRTVWSSAAPVTCPPEFRDIGPDHGALSRLARLTGGQVVSPHRLPTVGRAIRERDWRSLEIWLFAASLAMALAEWALTRIRFGGR